MSFLKNARGLLRTYSTAKTKVIVAESTNLQVPLNIHSLEGRYASAIYSVSAQRGTLKRVADELTSAKKLISESLVLQSLLNDPSVSKDARKNQFRKVLRENNSSDTVTNFFDVVIDNGRLQLAPKIISAFEQIMQAHESKVAIKITSSGNLDPAYLLSLKQLIRDKFLTSEQQPTFETVQDPKVLGGLIIEIGDRTVDLSSLSKVQDINKRLEETIN